VTRSEYLEWCKVRALEYVQIGDLDQAYVVMISGLANHPETASHPDRELMASLKSKGLLRTAGEMTRFIREIR
jgi:hypothetical protein